MSQHLDEEPEDLERCWRGSTTCHLQTSCDKTFQFGGDASSRSEWSIHLPLNIGGLFGRFQMFVIPATANTPFLPGRPVLKHFKVQRDYAADKMSVDGGPWTSTIKGPREEYLIDLHTTGDDWCRDWDFDLMTDDTLDNFTCNPDSDFINLEEHLNSTQLQQHSTSTFSPPTTFQPSTNQQQVHLIHHHNFGS